MSNCILYSSRTGNTKLLADALFAEHTDKFSRCCKVSEEVPHEDTLIMGFWTDKGTCDEDFLKLLEKLKNKKIFLFGTAGFGGSESYYKTILSRVKDNLDDSNTIIGSFMCQGKMPDGIRMMYKKQIKDGTNPKAAMLLDNFNKALPHPDKNDIAMFIQEVLKVI